MIFKKIKVSCIFFYQNNLLGNLKTITSTQKMEKSKKKGAPKSSKKPSNVEAKSTSSLPSEEIASLKLKDGALLIDIHAKPNAKENSIEYFDFNTFEIAIAAPPTDSEANEELICFLSEILDVSKSSLSLLKGQKSRNKVVRVSEWELSVDKTFELFMQYSKNHGIKK